MLCALESYSLPCTVICILTVIVTLYSLNICLCGPNVDLRLIQLLCASKRCSGIQGVRRAKPPEAETLLAFLDVAYNGSRKFASFSILRNAKNRRYLCCLAAVQRTEPGERGDC